MQATIQKLSEKKAAASSYEFKTWDSVCANWLEDVKAEV